MSRTKVTIFDRVVNQLSAAAASTSTSIATSSVTGSQAAAALMKFSGIGSEKFAERHVEEPILEEDGQLQPDVVGLILKWHAEAVARCIELSPAYEV